MPLVCVEWVRDVTFSRLTKGPLALTMSTDTPFGLLKRALLLCAVALLVAACASGGSRRGAVYGGFNDGNPYGSGQPGQPRPTVKVALLLPLSAKGSAANIARALKHHLVRRQYREAEFRLRAFYLHDRKARFRRHYFDEVVRRLKDLYLRKLPRHAEPAEVLARLRGVEELGLNPSEARLRFHVEAEACLKCGLGEAARSVLENAREAFPGAKEVESIEAMIAAARTS